KLSGDELVAALSSDNRYEREQATAVLFEDSAKAKDGAWKESAPLAALWFAQGKNEHDLALLRKCLSDKQPEVRAAAVRVLADWIASIPSGEAEGLLKTAVADEHPRVR